MASNVMKARDVVFFVDFALEIVGFIFFFTGFASPNWVQSWPRIYNGFKKIGLWEACFAGLVVPFDPREKAYHGCWWILAPEYQDIRDYIMPWWFVLTQVICVFVLILILINFILHLVLLATSGIKSRAPIGVVRAAAIINLFNALALTFTVILFGVAYYIDRNWMPHKELNYLSWSYGVTIVGTFFFIFACFPSFIYVRMTTEEYRRPDSTLAPLTGSAPPHEPTSYPKQSLGYPQSTSGGYPGSSPGGYPREYPVSTSSGYPGASPAGYPGSTSGGYPGSTSGGYPGSTSGGYPRASPGGYPGSSSQYPGGSTSSYPTKPSYPPGSTSSHPADISGSKLV